MPPPSTPRSTTTVARWPIGSSRSSTRVPVGGDLQDALAAMLLDRAGWVPVVDGDRLVGVLTPDAVYRTLRRSLADDTRPRETNVATA